MALAVSNSTGGRRSSLLALPKMESQLSKNKGQMLSLVVFAVLLTHTSAQEVDLSKVIPSGYNPQMKPGDPLDTSEYQTPTQVNCTINKY